MKHLFMTIAMAAALTACGHRASTDSGVEADSVSIDSTVVANEVALLKTDSIDIELTDTMADVHVSVDWPVEGNDTLLQGIRQYILKQLGIKKCTDIKAEIKKVAKTQYHELKTQWQEDRECRGEDMGMIYSSYQRISVDDVNHIPVPQFPPTFTKNGLVFLYQQYEIGPYAVGMPNFCIPYKKVLPYLTEEAAALVE